MDERIFKLFDIAREAIEKNGLSWVTLDTGDNTRINVYTVGKSDIHAYAYARKKMGDTYIWEDGEWRKWL